MNNDILSVPTTEPTQTPEPVVNTSKPKSKTGLFIAIGVVLVIAIATGVYFLFIRGVDKKQVINGTINKIFSNAQAFSQKLEDSLIIDYKKDIVKTTGSFKVSYDTNDSSIKEQLGGITSATLNYELSADLKNLQGNVDLELLENTFTVGKINMLLKDKNVYFKSDLFSDILRYDASQDIDWDAFDIEKLPDFKAGAYTKFIGKTKELLLGVIKDEYLTQESVDEEIDGVSIKGLKTTLILDEKNSKQISNDLFEAMKNDDEYLEILASIAMKTKEEVKESIEEQIESLNDNRQTLIAETKKTSYLNIYTTKQGKFLAFTGYEGENLIMSAVSNKGVTTIKLRQGNKDILKIDYNEKDKEFVWNNDKATSKDIRKVTVKLTDKSISIKIESDPLNLTLTGDEDITKDYISAKYTAEASIAQSGMNLTAKAEWNTKVEKGESINAFSTAGAKNVKYLTTEEESKLGNEIMLNLNESVIGQVIIASIQSKATSNESPYDLNY